MKTVRAYLFQVEIQFHTYLYWVPQNSRNNSMGQCQLMLENNEKNNKKILYLLNLKIWGLKGAALISFILNIKKDFDNLSFTSQWHNNSERL
jgi:hypothetical protein